MWLQAEVVEPPTDRRRILSVASIGLERPCDHSSGWGLRPLFDAHITQAADNLVACAIVLRMIDSVDDRHIVEVEGAHAFQAGDVDAVLVGIGAAAMVGVMPHFEQK